MSSTSAMLRRRPVAARQLHLEDLGPIAPPVAVRAAQVHVGEELHLDVLEAVAAAGRAAAVAGIEAEGAERVAALDRHGLAPRSACGSRRTRRRSSPGSSAWCDRSRTGPPAPPRRRARRRAARDARPAPRSACPWRAAAPAYSTSCTSVDLPEPDTPVTHTRRPSGISTSRSCRLCSLAPCTHELRIARARRAPVARGLRRRPCGRTGTPR